MQATPEQGSHGRHDHPAGHGGHGGGGGRDHDGGGRDHDGGGRDHEGGGQGGLSGWGVAPAIPLVANAVFALLWVFSAFGGWAEHAFCGTEARRDPDCVTAMNIAAGISLIPAAAASFMVAFAFAAPRIRRDIDRLDLLLAVSAFLWVGAEAILFALGYLAQS